MEHGHIDPRSLSPDDIAYRRALQSAKEKHAEGGGDPLIHQQELNTIKAEGGNDSSLKKKEEGKVGSFAAESAVGEVAEAEEEAGGENISDPIISTTTTTGIHQSSTVESNVRESSDEGRGSGGGMEGAEEGGGGSGLGSAPLGTGGGGGASSGVMQTSQRDISRRMAELEALERHPLPKLRDAEDQPKAIASTFQPPAHLPPSNASGYRFHGVNEHMRSGGGKAPRSQKMIMQPGGKYGQRY